MWKLELTWLFLILGFEMNPVCQDQFSGCREDMIAAEYQLSVLAVISTHPVPFGGGVQAGEEG